MISTREKERSITSRAEYGRISPTLIPKAALITGFPQSHQPLELSNVPSSIGSVVVSMTRVGKSAIGKIEAGKKSGKIAEKKSELIEENVSDSKKIEEEASDKNAQKQKLLKLPEDVNNPSKSPSNTQEKPPKLLSVNRKKKSLRNEKTGLPEWKHKKEATIMIDSDSQHVSEGQVQFINPASTIYTDEQLAYLSHPNRSSMDSNPIREEMIEPSSIDEIQVQAADQQMNTVNSSSENLDEPSSASVIDRKPVDNSRLNQTNANYYPTGSNCMQSRNSNTHSPVRNPTRFNLTGIPDNSSHSPVRNPTRSNYTGTPDDYLHMSPRRNSNSNSNAHMRRNQFDSRNDRANRSGDGLSDSITASTNQIASHVNELMRMLISRGRGSDEDDWRIDMLKHILIDVNTNNKKHKPSRSENSEDKRKHLSKRLSSSDKEEDILRTSFSENFAASSRERFVEYPMDEISHSNQPPVSYLEWCKLKEQAELVVDENRALCQQKLIYKHNLEATTQQYQAEIKDLSDKLRDSLKEKNLLSQQIMSIQLDLSQMSSKYEKLLDEYTDRVEKSVFEKQLDDLKRSHRIEMDRLRAENENLKEKVKASFKEREILAVKLTNTSLEKKQLMKELSEADKYMRKAEKEILHQSSLRSNHTAKESVVKVALSKVIDVAEQGLVEREKLLKELRKQKVKTGLAVTELLNEDKKIENMNKRVKKEKASTKKLVDSMKVKLKCHEEDMEDIREAYMKELKDLRTYVKEKEKLISDTQSKHQLTSNDIEKLCRSLNTL